MSASPYSELLRRVIFFFGSLRWAMGLLSIIAVACIFGTIVESRFDTMTARRYVYDAPWFGLWLALLCLNLICSTLTRWPWKQKHMGFVVTHAGIVLMLVGAMIGRSLGFEANITLNKEGEPLNRLVSTTETIFIVESPKTGALYTLPFDGAGLKRERRLPLPETQLRIAIDKHSKHLVEQPVVLADGMGTGAGVAITLTSGMALVPVEVALHEESLPTYDLFGRGKITLVREWLDNEKASYERMPFEETHVLFQKEPSNSIIHSFAEHPSMMKMELLRKNNRYVLAVEAPKLKRQEIEVTQNIGKTVQLKDGTELMIASVWDDFTMQNGRPASLSDKPNNPAAFVSVRGHTLKPVERQMFLKLEGEGVAYRVYRATELIQSGIAKQGDTVATGWADWQMKVNTLSPQARLSMIYAEQPQSEKGIPGIRARLLNPQAKEEGKSLWIASGTTQYLKLGEQMIKVGYGLKTIPLDFTVELDHFEVPRDEGTDEPSDFISHLVFRESPTQSHSARVAMNHPASFPPQWWKSLLGMNYKFSQAGWNPEQLTETTLQVLYDPGWAWKWIGSIMISLGIFSMFYFRGDKRTDKDFRL